MTRLFIQGQRQSGKTNFALYEFMKDPSESLLIVHSMNTAKDLQREIRKHFKYDDITLERVFRNIKSASTPDDIYRGVRPRTVVIDEMLLFSNYKELFDMTMKQPDVENIFVYSTLACRGDYRRKEQKKFIRKKLKKNGFTKIKIKSLDPEAHRKEKEYAKQVKAAKKQEKRFNPMPGAAKRALRAGFADGFIQRNEKGEFMATPKKENGEEVKTGRIFL